MMPQTYNRTSERSLNTDGLREGATIAVILLAAMTLLPGSATQAQQKSPGAGPIVVLETVKGTIEFETYPDEAPKTVANIVALVKRGFYNGLRFHRAEKGLLIQVGDPVTRDMSKIEWWGRQGSGKPIGAAEFSKKRTHVRGAVAMAHTGSAADAQSQFYITLRPAPEWNGKYVVFGRVLTGMDVVATIQKTDILKKASLKE
jgi:cyclophilin family peptidyl-prolyl cis-trans isomerase